MDGQTDRRTYRWTVLIALPSRLTRSIAVEQERRKPVADLSQLLIDLCLCRPIGPQAVLLNRMLSDKAKFDYTARVFDVDICFPQRTSRER